MLSCLLSVIGTVAQDGRINPQVQQPINSRNLRLFMLLMLFIKAERVFNIVTNFNNKTMIFLFFSVILVLTVNSTHS